MPVFKCLKCDSVYVTPDADATSPDLSISCPHCGTPPPVVLPAHRLASLIGTGPRLGPIRMIVMILVFLLLICPAPPLFIIMFLMLIRSVFPRDPTDPGHPLVDLVSGAFEFVFALILALVASVIWIGFCGFLRGLILGTASDQGEGSSAAGEDVSGSGSSSGSEPERGEPWSR